MYNWKLGDFSNPDCFHQPIDISGEDKDLLIKQLESMLRIRAVERQLAERRKDGEVRGPVHLGVGQEAIAVGVASNLRKTDRVFGGHRSHSHVLAMGGSPYKLFAEVLGKSSGMSKGMGGSMHLWDKENGFYGAVPIVSGTVSLAVGAGLAAKLQGVEDVGVAYIGDGAVEEGVVHESLNLARVTNSQVLFVIENNLFASHMHISLRQPYESTARFAEVNGIPYEVVDGNDVVAVKKAAESLLRGARTSKGPGFLEAVTYRWYGHVDWREDIDVGVNRSSEDVTKWHKRDPVARLASALMDAGLLNEKSYEGRKAALQNEIQSSWDKAKLDPYPEPSALTDYVYATKGLV